MVHYSGEYLFSVSVSFNHLFIYLVYDLIMEVSEASWPEIEKHSFSPYVNDMASRKTWFL